MKLTCRPGSGMSRSAVKICTDADAPGATFPAKETRLYSAALCHGGSIQDGIVQNTQETNAATPCFLRRRLNMGHMQIREKVT